MLEDLLAFDDPQDASDEMDHAVQTRLAPPRAQSNLYGHEEIEKMFLEAINQNTLPHAIVLSGPKGIGKSTFAFRLAKGLLKHGLPDTSQDSLFGSPEALPLTSLNISEEDPIFRKVMAGGHPDLLTIEPAMDEKKGRPKESLDVDTVRKIAPFLRMTASNNGWRIVIVDEADSMTRAAQNAVLKILEEPPSNTLLILVCHRAGALIPTIRSRCRFVTMNCLNDSVVIEMLRKEFPSASIQDIQLIARISEGSIGQAISLMDQNGIEVIHSLLATLDNWKAWQWPMIHRLSEAIGRSGDDNTYHTFTQLFDWVISSILFAKAKGDVFLENPLNSKALQEMYTHYSLEEWVKICDNLKAHFDTYAKANLDKRQAILGAFSLLA